ECVLGISAASEAEVEAIVERARAAGAVIATEPAPQPWGYASAFSDLDGHLWLVTAASIPA
ncbi:MAG TPA: VOC family protein, partial [Microthrixaceae bacterium]|nr:VOC family protein [Microthrixaceae bacterium]